MLAGCYFHRTDFRYLLPLTVVDWCCGKATQRTPEGDALHVWSSQALVGSLVSSMKEEMLARRVPQVADELLENTAGEERTLEIHSTRLNSEWVPATIVRIGDACFRLEHVETRQPPRPFVFLLRRLPAGVPWRNVIVYGAPLPPPG